MTPHVEMQLELFGWEVVRTEADFGSVPMEGGRLWVAELWELASRWSPPPVPLCLLVLVCPESGQFWGVEIACSDGAGGANRLEPPYLWQCPRDHRGRPIFDQHSLESFAAGLGRFRAGTPAASL
jgi:hypothetical protein